MQFPFNWMAQGIVQGGLRDVCVVRVQEQVLPEVMAIDAWVRPRKSREEREMLGRIAFRKAPEELFTLPANAWERAIVEPLLVQLEQDLPRMGAITVSVEEEDVMISYQEAVRIWKEERRKMDEARQRLPEVERQVEKAQNAMAHLFEKRLHRDLTRTERGVVRERFGTLGPERLSDVVLDFESDALAAWLADPHAT